MYEWLYLMLAGLGMDIVGVWMLAGPILNISLKNKSTLEKQTADAIKEYKRVKDQKPLQPDSEMATWSGVARLEAIIYQLHLRILNEKIEHKQRAVIALIIISAGFTCQIFANMIQAFI